jgi:hypothetical protein
LPERRSWEECWVNGKKTEEPKEETKEAIPTCGELFNITDAFFAVWNGEASIKDATTLAKRRCMDDRLKCQGGKIQGGCCVVGCTFVPGRRP